MTELLTAQQMRELETDAIESGQVSGLELMERAGLGVLQATLSKWPDLSARAHHALVLCGPGNNGGDGFVIARLLVARGWSVDLFLFGDPAKLPPDARVNYDRWQENGSVLAWDADTIHAVSGADVVIDAVFGIGLTRALPPEIADVLGHYAIQQRLKGTLVHRVAVDCPSGLNLDTGRFLGGSTPTADAPATLNVSDLTVTFHTPKPGHFLDQGPALCRDLKVIDLELRGDALERTTIGSSPDPQRTRLVTPQHFGPLGLSDLSHKVWPLGVLPKFKEGAHKYDFGHVVVFSGGVGRGGAARLAARAALRIGAGLVTLICPKAAVMENAIHLNAIMLRGLDDPDGLIKVADERVSGFCVGPGLGVGARTRDLVAQVLARRSTGAVNRDPVVVLDADALTSFDDDPQALFEIVHPRTVITPHGGEFARLFPDLAKELQAGASKLDIVRASARRAGCVVILKGHDTVIAQPDGGASLHAASYGRAAAWLATAGAGDVLAGLIAGLAAAPRSADLFTACEAAVWLHVQAALSFGPGLIAEDLPEQLPKVLRELSA